MRRLRDPALGLLRAIANGSAAWSSTRCAQAGLDAPVGELIDAHGEGRRRATFHARRGRAACSKSASRRCARITSSAIDRCPVLAPSLDGAIPAAWAVAEALAPQNKPLDIQVTATDGGIDVDVRGSGPLQPARTGALARLAETHSSRGSPATAS